MDVQSVLFSVPVTKATPNRKTRVRFNDFMPSVLSSAVFFSRDATEIGRGELSKTTDCAFIKDIGWRLKKHADPGEHWEYELGQTPIPGTIPPSGMLSFYANRKPTLSGVTYSGRPDQSQPMYLKQVPAGSSWELRLAEDQFAYPGPTSGDGFLSIAQIDRLFVADNNHQPDDAVSFIFSLQGSITSALGMYACAYFSGPAGSDGALNGIGQYCLGLAGGGEAFLYEKGKVPGGSDWVWRLRSRFNVGDAHPNTSVRFTVSSDCYSGCDGSWKGKRLTIKTMLSVPIDQGSGFMLLRVMTNGAINAIHQQTAKTFTYNAPNAKDRPITIAPVRIDGRRDIRMAFQAFDSEYPESGTIIDQPFPLGALATPDEPIVIDTYCHRPFGTDIDLKLYAVDGANAGDELTGTMLIDDCLGKQYSFEIPSGYPLSTMFRAEFELTGPGTKSPTLIQYVVGRNEITEPADDSNTFDFPLRAASGVSVPMRVIENVSVMGLSSNPESESATVALCDLAATQQDARMRTGTPLDIDILDDEGEFVTNLFHGIIQTAGTSDLPGKANRFPQPGAWRGDFAIASELRRLNRRLAPTRISLWDVIEQKPLKVTAALKVLLKFAGYSDAYCVAIPDLPIRISGSDQEATMIEPDTPLGDICSRLVFDYLGGLFFFDKNAGADGSWRVLVWPRQPYNTVLRFDPGHPGAGKLKHVIGAYGTTTADNGQIIQHLPMFGRKVTTYEPPEGNMVIVIGGAKEGAVGGVQLVQMAVNVESFNALNLADSHDSYPDPTNPDYLRDCVPIVVRDVSINTPDAINFVTRRYYDAACCAKETIKFNSLLPFIDDVTDAHQTNVRIPRVGDMVQVKQSNGSWKDYIIASCNPDYRRAHMMRADFEIVSTSRMADIAVAIGSISSASYMNKVTEHFKAALGFPNGRFVNVGNAPGNFPRVGVAGLPSATVPAIQDLDPDSATFGQFHFMAGYDPLP